MTTKKIEKARLADIDVDEVSYVDRAANKRKFLFMKRDTSEDETKGGESLELLKIFKGHKEAIDSLDGIDANLIAFDKAFDSILQGKEITEEQKKFLIEKREEYSLIKDKMNHGFEVLFLDKKADEESDEEDDEEDDEEEEVEDEEEEETKETKEDVKDTKKSEDIKKEDKKDEIINPPVEKTEEEFSEEEQKLIDEITKTAGDTIKEATELKDKCSK